MQEDFIKPNVTNEEIILDPNKVIMSKTDKFGTFEFANEYFMEISGYEEYELMGKSMFCVQHPDMPEVVFKMMWEKLLNKENFHVVVKNLAKNGKYYWSVTNFTFKVDDDNEIIAIYSKRVAANKKSVDFFSRLYKTLLKIEQKNGIKASERYIIGYLEEKQTNFEKLVNSFYNNFTDEAIFSEKKKIEKKTKTGAGISIQLNEKPILKKDSNTQKLEDLQKQVKKVVENTKDTTQTKKNLFQKLFGKTEEEIEEERKRRENE